MSWVRESRQHLHRPASMPPYTSQQKKMVWANPKVWPLNLPQNSAVFVVSGHEPSSLEPPNIPKWALMTNCLLRTGWSHKAHGFAPSLSRRCPEGLQTGWILQNRRHLGEGTRPSDDFVAAWIMLAHLPGMSPELSYKANQIWKDILIYLYETLRVLIANLWLVICCLNLLDLLAMIRKKVWNVNPVKVYNAWSTM